MAARLFLWIKSAHSEWAQDRFRREREVAAHLFRKEALKARANTASVAARPGAGVLGALAAGPSCALPNHHSVTNPRRSPILIKYGPNPGTQSVNRFEINRRLAAHDRPMINQVEVQALRRVS